MKTYKPPKPPGRGRASGLVVSREAVLRIIGRTSVARSDNPLRDIRDLVLQLPAAHRVLFNPAARHPLACTCGHSRIAHGRRGHCTECKCRQWEERGRRVGVYVCKECRRPDGDCTCLDGPTLIRMEEA